MQNYAELDRYGYLTGTNIPATMLTVSFFRLFFSVSLSLYLRDRTCTHVAETRTCAVINKPRGLNIAVSRWLFAFTNIERREI